MGKGLAPNDQAWPFLVNNLPLYILIDAGDGCHSFWPQWQRFWCVIQVYLNEASSCEDRRPTILPQDFVGLAVGQTRSVRRIHFALALVSCPWKWDASNLTFDSISLGKNPWPANHVLMSPFNDIFPSSCCSCIKRSFTSSANRIFSAMHGRWKFSRQIIAVRKCVIMQ